MSKIGKNIKKIRNVRGLSQQAFADLFQLTRGNISSYEEFRAEPKLDVVVKIANFFSIPLSDFVEKDLSVNELLHYNTHIVLETDRLKMGQQMVNIPYISSLYLNDYIEKYRNEEITHLFPNITLPITSKFKLIALEITNPEILPSGFNFISGDVVILEHVEKENYHRIINKLGFMIENNEIKSGIFREERQEIYLTLNDRVRYPFILDNDVEYWFLRATYKQDL